AGPAVAARASRAETSGPPAAPARAVLAARARLARGALAVSQALLPAAGTRRALAPEAFPPLPHGRGSRGARALAARRVLSDARHPLLPVPLLVSLVMLLLGRGLQGEARGLGEQHDLALADSALDLGPLAVVLADLDRPHVRAAVPRHEAHGGTAVEEDR